jgi:multidrug efflux system outer membrane protein
VADALVTIDKLKDQRVEKEVQVTALENSSRLSRLRYDAGFSNYLEVLIADQNLFDAEIELARTRGAEFISVVQLYRALGGGWQP